MTKWQPPKSTMEMDQILTQARTASMEMDHGSMEFEIMLTQLAEFAGCFNHHITRQQRTNIIDFLAKIGDDAIDPVLQALINIPRAEQFDVTRAFIDRLRDNDGR